MIIAYELFLASGVRTGRAAKKLARFDETQDFYRQFQETLQTIGFLEHSNPERLMFSLRQGFGRALQTGREVRMLRGRVSTIKVFPA